MLHPYSNVDALEIRVSFYLPLSNYLPTAKITTPNSI